MLVVFTFYVITLLFITHYGHTTHYTHGIHSTTCLVDSKTSEHQMTN